MELFGMVFCGSFSCLEQRLCTFDGCRAKTELELDSASLASSGGQSCDRGGHRESLPRNGRLQQRAWQSTGSLLSALSLQ
ncbi:unnamed protein product, partial [Ixodes pacificus]